MDEEKNYSAEIINIFEMTRTKVDGQFRGNFQVKLPATEGIAVLVKEI